MKDQERDKGVEDKLSSNDESSSKSSESFDEKSEHFEKGSSSDELPKYIKYKDIEINIPQSMKSICLKSILMFFRMG